MKALGVKPKQPIVEEEGAPPFPELLGYLWNWFGEIAAGTASNGMSPPVMTWGDIAAWAALSRTPLEPWESRTLVMLGAIRANVLGEKWRREAKDAAATRDKPRKK